MNERSYIPENSLIYTRHGSVAVLRLNRPEQANALNRDLFIRLTEDLERLRWDDTIKALIITGAGAKAFCSGIDLKERARKDRNEIFVEREKIIRPLYLALGNFQKPTIAALNGAAFGGGAELALTCDLRVATPGARFAQSEIKWGMIPSCGACQRLRLIAGMGVAKDIILTGRTLEASEAYRLGIYNRLVADDKLMDEALKLAMQISENPSTAVEQAKRALEFGASISAALDFDFEASKQCFLLGDALDRPKIF